MNGAELDAMLSDIAFPAGFPDDFEPLECLAHGHGTETFLVQKKGDPKKYIAKCYDRGVYAEIREAAILQAIERDGLPAFVAEYRDDDYACVVRDYIEGTPLNRYMAGRPLTQARAVSICAELCDLLTYLHTREPRIIHRDIKPQNVIIRPNGSAALIDFDAARTYDESAEADTQFMGTRAYAPPEQYGFTQTDSRADVYSLGVLLRAMLTGQTNPRASVDAKPLDAVVRRCTAFAPEQRFADTDAVKRALLRVSGGWTKRHIARACIAAALAVALLCAGFAAGRYTNLLRPDTTVYATFTEPLMEKAVRAQLGKAAGEPLTAEEVREVRAIYIFGTEVSATEDVFENGLGGWTLPRGGLTSLADVALMPNLEVLYVAYQTLVDISPVASLTKLRRLHVNHTYVRDLAPIAALPALDQVDLFDTNVSDLSPLTGIPQIKYLELGHTLIGGVADIPDLKGLTRISVRDIALTDIEGLERFPRLDWLGLCKTGLTDLTPLLSLPVLREIEIDETMRPVAEALGDVKFNIHYLG